MATVILRQSSPSFARKINEEQIEGLWFMFGKSLIIACLAMVFVCFAEDKPAPLPFKQDPPIQIDGVLDDWHDVLGIDGNRSL